LERYRALLDADLVAFIEAHEAGFPAELASAPLARQRAFYDAMCCTFHTSLPPDIETRDTAIALPDRSVPLRIYRPLGHEAPAIVLYFHGGGFVFGGLDSHGDICADLCSRAGVEVTSVDYRLAPEHRHPAAFDDAMAAFEWSISRSARAPTLIGESAGGTLVAAVAHRTRADHARPRGVVLVYPGLGGRGEEPSFREHAEAPLLSAVETAYYQSIRLRDPAEAYDPTASPMRDTDFSGLPPTFVSAAEFDPLRDEGARYCDLVRAAGGQARCIVEPGLVHGFLRARKRVARAAAAFDRIVEAVKSMSGR
jgi:acetyl esterase